LFNHTKVGNNVGGERQALLRVETFNNVLDGVYAYSLEHTDYFADSSKALEFCNNLIRNSGYICGNKFALREENSFKKEVASKIPSEQMKEILEKWCAFDSKAGLGSFTVGKLTSEKIDGVEFILFEITLEDDFVSQGLPDKLKGNRQNERCNYMRGYCEGVCDELCKFYYPGFHFKVESCDENVCRKKHNASKKCVYRVGGSSSYSRET